MTPSAKHSATATSACLSVSQRQIEGASTRLAWVPHDRGAKLRKLRWDGLGRYILTLTIVFAEHQDSRFKDAYETQSQPSAPPRGNLCAPQQYNPVQECGVREVPSKAQQSSCQLHGYGTLAATVLQLPLHSLSKQYPGDVLEFQCSFHALCAQGLPCKQAMAQAEASKSRGTSLGASAGANTRTKRRPQGK